MRFHGGDDSVVVLWGASMSEAMKLIVDGYVRPNNRQALKDVLGHRLEIGKRLKEQSKSWVDVSSSLRLIDEEIAEIRAGLEQLDRGASA
jgi:hypothetical protein